MSVQSTKPEESEKHFEVLQEDDRVGKTRLLVVFFATIAITVVAIWIQGRMLAARRASLGVHERAAAPVAPRQIDAVHQTLIDRDRHGLDLRAQQRASLTQFSWVDRDHGVARIPIDDAMNLLVAHPELATAMQPSPASSASVGATP